MLTVESIEYPYLIDSVSIEVKDRIASVIKKGKYKDISIFRVTPICAVALSFFDGRNHIKHIVLIIKDYFRIDEKSAVLFINRVLSMYDGLVIEANGHIRILPNAKSLLTSVDKYTEDDIRMARQKYPKSIYYSATDKCKFLCKYCYRDSKMNSVNEEYVSFERWETILKEAGDNGTQFLNIGGGDPLCRKDIHKLVEIASKNKIKTKVSTKMRLSKEQVLSLKKAKLTIMQVSIDSLEKDVCHFITGIKDSFDQAIDTIKISKEVGLYVLVSTTVTKYNIDQIGELIKILNNYAVDEIHVGVYVPSCGRNESSFVPRVEQLNNLDKVIYDLKNDENIKINIDYTYPLFTHNIGNISQMSVERATCRANRDIITIRHDGIVYFCDALLNDSRIIHGDIKKQTIKEIWNSEEMLKWITPNKELYKGTVCGECDLFYKCFDKRCYKRSIMNSGNPIDIDPLCPRGDLKEGISWKEV